MDVLSRKVLQLTKHYEADGVISMYRALVLVFFRHEAQLVEEVPGMVIRTAHREFPAPSVISLNGFHNLRKRRQESGKHRFHIFVRDKFRCQYCAQRFQPWELTLDHIIPRSRGGEVYDPQNLATCCQPCNQRKGDRTPDEARMPLLATPAALRYGLDRAMLAHYAEEYLEWRPYLYILDREVA